LAWAEEGGLGRGGVRKDGGGGGGKDLLKVGLLGLLSTESIHAILFLKNNIFDVLIVSSFLYHEVTH
jgi:hypothetical protein